MARKTSGVSEANGKCYINWYEGKKRKHKALDIPYTASGIEKAARVRAKIIEDFKLGKVDRGPCPTFGELAQKRLDTLTGVHRKKEKGRLNKYWIQFYPIPINAIHYDNLLEIDVEHLAPKTVKHIYGAGSGVFALAVKSRWISDNPAKLLGSETKLNEVIVDPFSRAERDSILAEMKGNPKLYYILRFYCGLRPSEVISLRWADYDRDARELIIRRRKVEGEERSSTKNRKDRRVPVHPVVQQALKAHTRVVGKENILLTSAQNPYQSPFRLAKPLVSVMQRLGIRYRSPYNARHTCACMMLEAEMAPGYCAKVLGHSLEMFFKIYADYIDKDQGERQRQKMEAYL